jgi:hypothetical protein
VKQPLVQTAEETLAILTAGAYVAPSGKAVPLGARVDAAVRGTKTLRPDEVDALVAGLGAGAAPSSPPRIEVTGETTAQAGRRLVEREGETRVAALNFASARRACLREQHAYYEANRASPTHLYTDHLVYSPDVPFFRDDALALLEQPFLLSILTSPAPNAGAALAQHPGTERAVYVTLARRARQLLAVAAAEGHRTLVLGAWGCGAFRNDPDAVAPLFAGLLAEEPLRSAFSRVVFAVYDPAGRNRAAFSRMFAAT